MSSPDWEGVIRVLYQRSPEKIDLNDPSGHAFVEDTGLTADEIQSIIEKLYRWELIRVTDSARALILTPEELSKEPHEYELTNEGFSVAHDREIADADRRVNNSLVGFTLALVLVEAAGYAPLGRIVKAVVIVLVLILVLAQMYIERRQTK